MPDATNVFDYNRYMYARGNPMKYNDPSGHCSSNKDGSRADSDAGCWQAADEWRGTFGIGDYTNVDEWNKYFASSSAITKKILRNGLYAYWSPLYTQWGIYHAIYHPAPIMSNDNTIVEDPFSTAAKQYCQEHDCIGLGLDGTSVAASGFAVVASIACGPAALGCGAGVAGGISTVASAVGAVRTWSAFRAKPSVTSGIDAQMSTATTLAGGLAKNPKVALAVSVVQLVYDNGGNKLISSIFDHPKPQSDDGAGGGGSGGFK